MKRLPIRGASFATLRRDRHALRQVLIELGVGSAFDDEDLDQIYSELGRVHGRWLSEQGAKDVSPVVRALRSTGINLIKTAKLLSGRETGLRTHVEIEATVQAVQILTLEPSIGSLDKAHQILDAFRQEADRIGHALLVGSVELAQKGGKKKSDLAWFGDFTALLLDIAKKAGVKPSLGKDRIENVRTGWLFNAARQLETFLDPYMRSPSEEACGKRLERARKNLAKSKATNRSRTRT